MRKRHDRHRALMVVGLCALMIIVLDRLTKALVVEHLSSGAVQPVIPGVVDFMLVYNRGAAWGIFEGARFFFVVGAVVTIAAVLAFIWIIRRHSTLSIIALGLFSGGAIGNAIDRALSGAVIDFIRPLFIDFPLFNVADSGISIGVILLLISVFFARPDLPSATADVEAPPEDAEKTTPDEPEVVQQLDTQEDVEKITPDEPEAVEATPEPGHTVTTSETPVAATFRSPSTEVDPPEGTISPAAAPVVPPAVAPVAPPAVAPSEPPEDENQLSIFDIPPSP